MFFHFLLGDGVSYIHPILGDAGFEPAASWSRTKRATAALIPEDGMNFQMLGFVGSFNPIRLGLKSLPALALSNDRVLVANLASYRCANPRIRDGNYR